MRRADYFVRFPTELLEALLRTPLNGTQCRILFWVIRQTLGWHRKTVQFSWYRIAGDLGLSRPSVYRAGQALLRKGILTEDKKQLGVETDFLPVAAWQRCAPRDDVAEMQLSALPGSNVNIVDWQRKRCRQATVFRREKESKERLKTSKDTGSTNDTHHRAAHLENTQPRRLTGAANPIPGKYDGLSEN